MRYFFQKKKDAQSRYKNPPVSGVKKIAIAPPSQSHRVVMYKMSAGPLKETTAERDMRKAKEAQARWDAKETEREAKRLRSLKPKASDTEVKARAKALRKARNEEKRNSPEACARVVERLRLRAEAKKKSTSVVIAITITDPNKS